MHAHTPLIGRETRNIPPFTYFTSSLTLVSSSTTSSFVTITVTRRWCLPDSYVEPLSLIAASCVLQPGLLDWWFEATRLGIPFISTSPKAPGKSSEHRKWLYLRDNLPCYALLALFSSLDQPSHLGLATLAQPRRLKVKIGVTAISKTHSSHSSRLRP